VSREYHRAPQQQSTFSGRQVPPKPAKIIDLNTDFGQSTDRNLFEGKEKTLLNYVSSVNIPCCVHDGEPAQAMQDIQRAKQNQCAVGAHIAYPDPKHFGYQAMDISAEELRAWIILQLGSFGAFCKVNKTEFEHVRPHGALYTAFINNPEVAGIVAQAVQDYSEWLILIAPVSPISEALQATLSIQIHPELYLGKRVNGTGAIDLDKAQENLNPQATIEQVRQFLNESSVTSVDGQVVKLPHVKTLHLSPKLQGNMLIAERLQGLNFKFTPPSLTVAGAAGWL
jgi:5-oxoprolinase (ATP-hydrolysing) subunit A